MKIILAAAIAVAVLMLALVFTGAPHRAPIAMASSTPTVAVLPPSPLPTEAPVPADTGTIVAQPTAAAVPKATTPNTPPAAATAPPTAAPPAPPALIVASITSIDVACILEPEPILPTDPPENAPEAIVTIHVHNWTGNLVVTAMTSPGAFNPPRTVDVQVNAYVNGDKTKPIVNVPEDGVIVFSGFTGNALAGPETGLIGGNGTFPLHRITSASYPNFERALNVTSVTINCPE